MIFLYYDSNNDGYICNNDLVRIQEIAQKSKLIKEDYELIKNMSSKIKYSNLLPYK
jgi:Ca2+-binding EF-hand superfamily protein